MFNNILSCLSKNIMENTHLWKYIFYRVPLIYAYIQIASDCFSYIKSLRQGLSEFNLTTALGGGSHFWLPTWLFHTPWPPPTQMLIIVLLICTDEQRHKNTKVYKKIWYEVTKIIMVALGSMMITAIAWVMRNSIW